MLSPISSSGVRELRPGQRIKIRMGETVRGLTATAVAILPEPEPDPKPRLGPPARRGTAERIAGERKSGLIGELLSIDEEHGHGLVALPELDAIAIADIAPCAPPASSTRARPSAASSATSNSPHPSSTSVA